MERAERRSLVRRWPPVHFFELASRHAQPLAIPFFTMFLATCFPRSCGEPISDARYGKAP